MVYGDTYKCFITPWREQEGFTQNSILVATGENLIGVGLGAEHWALCGPGDVPLLELGAELTREHFVIL